LRHAQGIPVAGVSGAAVGVAAVDDHGPAGAPRHTLTVEPHRCGLHPVTGEHTGHGGRGVRQDEAEVFVPVFFNTSGHAGGFKPWAWNDLHGAISCVSG